MLFFDFFFGIVLGLILEQQPHTASQLNQAADSAFGGLGHLHRVHTTVFAVVHFPIHQRIGKIADSGIGFNGMIFALQFLLAVIGGDLTVDVPNGL